MKNDWPAIWEDFKANPEEWVVDASLALDKKAFHPVAGCLFSALWNLSILLFFGTFVVWIFVAWQAALACFIGYSILLTSTMNSVKQVLQWRAKRDIAYFMAAVAAGVLRSKKGSTFLVEGKELHIDFRPDNIWPHSRN